MAQHHRISSTSPLQGLESFILDLQVQVDAKGAEVYRLEKELIDAKAEFKRSAKQLVQEWEKKFRKAGLTAINVEEGVPESPVEEIGWTDSHPVTSKLCALYANPETKDDAINGIEEMVSSIDRLVEEWSTCFDKGLRGLRSRVNGFNKLREVKDDNKWMSEKFRYLGELEEHLKLLSTSFGYDERTFVPGRQA